MGWCNTYTDNLGDVIREFKKMEVVATPDTNQVKHFNAANKNTILQKLRAAAVTNNNNLAYLRLAKDFNYQAADEFEESNCEDSTLDENTAKKLEKIAKKHAGKSDKDREYHPYKKKQQQYMPPQQQYVPPQQQQQYVPPQQQFMPPQQQYMPGAMNQFPPMQQASQAMQGVRPPWCPCSSQVQLAGAMVSTRLTRDAECARVWVIGKQTRSQSFKSARLLGVEVHNDFDCVSINKA